MPGRFGPGAGLGRADGIAGQKMDIHTGDQVLVNVAPFIGSLRRNKQSVACEVLAVEGDEVEIRTLAPYREVNLRVERFWIDRKLEPLGV
jgi:hypothetical protein